MAVSTSDKFFESLREIGLLSEADLDDAVQATADLSDPTEIARRLISQGLLSRWQASQLVAGRLPAYLGKYKLLDMLSSSDTGAVFLAEHEQMERRVILRTIKRKADRDGDSVSQFPSDARAVASLDHRNVIHIFDVDKEGSTYYLVMEYVRGEDLQTFVQRKGPLAFDAAAGYIALAARGLAQAHEHHICHHRFRPDRLLIDTKGELKILDVGLARLVDPDEANIRATDQLPENVDYLAPEQTTGKNKVDHRADIYALGCCLYYVLTGSPPFPEGSAEQRLKARIRRTPPSVLNLRPDTPPQLADICAKMMATQPRERMTSSEEVARQLNQWLRANQKSRRAAPTAAPAAKRTGDQPSDGDMVALSDFAIQIDSIDRKKKSSTFGNGKGNGAADTPIAAISPIASGSRDSRRRSKPGEQPLAVAQPAKPPAKTADGQSPDKPKISPIVLWGSVGGVAALLLVGLAVYLLWPSGTDPTQAGDKDKVAAADGDKDKSDADKVAVPEDGDGKDKGTAEQGGGNGEDGGPAAPQLLSDTLAHWRFEDGSAGAYVKNLEHIGSPQSVQDISGHGNHLYCIGPSLAPRTSDQVPRDPLRLEGTEAQNKLSLDDTQPAAGDGKARYLITDSQRAEPKVDLATFGLELWTIEASFSLKDLAGQQTVLGKDGPEQKKAASFAMKVNGETRSIEVAAVDGSGQLRTVSSTPTVALAVDQWYHVAAVSDGKKLTLYVAVDGGETYQQCNTVDFEGPLLGHAGPWSVGCGLLGGQPTDDAMVLVDEVRISAVALASSELLFSKAPKQVVTVDPPDGGNGEGENGTGGETTPSRPTVSADTPIKFHDIDVVSVKCDQDAVKLKAHGSNDGSYIASGADQDKVIYTVVARPKTALSAVTGFRLEALPDSSLPGGGSGRHAGDGQFTVTDFVVSEKEEDAKNWKRIRLKSAKASASADKWKIQDALDDKPASSGWAVPADAVKRAHWAVFAMDPAGYFAATSKTRFQFEIHQRRDTKFSLGRFRLAVRTGSQPGEEPGRRILADARRANPLEIAADPVTLPPVDSKEPLDLGKIFIEDPSDLVASLLGGNTGHGAKGAFSIGRSTANDGSWDIRYKPKDGDGQAIARLAVDGETLRFGWQATAASQSDSEYLRNCALSCRVGDVERSIRLRAPARAEPLQSPLGKAVRRGPFRADIDFPPDPGTTQVEVKLDEQVFGKYALEPEGAFGADKGQAAVLLGADQSLRFLVTSSFKRSTLALIVRPVYRAPHSEADVPFSLERLTRSHMAASQQTEQVSAALAEVIKLQDRKRPSNAEKARLMKLGQALSRMFPGQKPEQIQAQLDAQVKRLEGTGKLLAMAEKLSEDEMAKIQVRVFRTVGDTQVDLVRTTGWSSEGQPAAPKDDGF